MHSNEEAVNSPSPSFNSYFNTDLAEVVARVATEFVTVDDDDDFFSSNAQNDEIRSEQSEDLEDEGDFEFNLKIPADGELRQVYPVFDRDLLRDYDLVGEVESRPSEREEAFIRSQFQLKNLFLEDREADRRSLSSSSEEEDELEEIPDGTYCVWMPNDSRLASPSPGRCRKSNSTGSSASVTEKVKTWRLRDLLKRSKSDGKDRRGMILLTPKKKKATASGAGAARRTAARDGYLIGRSRAAAEKNKRRSYLPYRQDLLGFSVNPQPFRKMNPLPFS
ncbi:hypothetical protein V2J09_005523 [Rumex salicifolius]